MVLPRRLPPKQIAFRTLKYSDSFDYPLTLEELWFWQIFSSFTKNQLSHWPHRIRGYYHLKNRASLVDMRQARAIHSQAKYDRAVRIAKLISFLPSVRAVYITGALAMNNSPENDDIDLMLVTASHTLWLTRLIVVLFLAVNGLRRSPGHAEHSSTRVKDKICDNLYLDLNHLQIHHLPINQSPINQSTNLFLAHEILQAKCIFDRGGVHHQFLSSNSWIRKYLPVAYHKTIAPFANVIAKPSDSPGILVFQLLLYILNYSLFLVQYLYMRPGLSREKIGLGYAFFHPRTYPVLSLADNGESW